MKLLKTLGALLVLVILLLIMLVAAALKPMPARPAVGDALIADGAAGEVEYFRSVSVSDSGKGNDSGDENSPVLVLLPSYARSASDFNELAVALNQAGYQTLAIQPGGIGNSSWPGVQVKLDHYANAIKQVLQAERIDSPVVVIGHAFGNRIARSFASFHPEQTRALVLLAAGGRETTPPEVSQAIQTTLFGFSRKARADAVQSAFFAPGNTAPDYWIDGWYPVAGLSQANATSTTEFERWGDGGNSPMLVLQSMQDKAAPPISAGLKLLADFPDRVTYQSVNGAGHALLPEQPQWIVDNILSYLQSIQY